MYIELEDMRFSGLCVCVYRRVGGWLLLLFRGEEKERYCGSFGRANVSLSRARAALNAYLIILYGLACTCLTGFFFFFWCIIAERRLVNL